MESVCLMGDHPSHLMVQWCAHMFGDVLNGCFERWRCFGLNHGNLGYLIWLVVWEHLDYFPYIGKFIIPTGELIFFRGVAQPPTSYVQTKPNQSVEVIYFLSVDGNCKPIPQASTLQIGDQIQQPGYLSFICHQIISHLLETCHEFSPRNYTLCCGFGASVFGQSRRLVVISRNYSGRMFLLNQAIECDIIEYYRCLSPKSPFWMLY